MTPRLRLCGLPSVRTGDAWRPWPASAPRALLVLLACREGWWTREALVALLRPDAPEGEARRYVRQLVHRARHLPEGAGVEIDGHRVRWSSESDVGAFRQAALALDAAALAVPDPAALSWPLVGHALDALAAAVGDGRVAPPVATALEWNAPGTPRR
jgi:DNA-binding SARP family transcriptional activator